MNLTFLDLEMNQPSNKIIQVGWTIADPISGRSYEIKGRYVKLFEPLAPMISNLCGVQQDVLDAADPLIEVYKELIADHYKHECVSTVVVWGEGDMRILRNQVQMYLNDGMDWPFGFATINAKSLYQSLKLKRGELHLKGGLARSLVRLGLKFEGRKHNARDDAYNTFKAYGRLLQELK